MTRQLSVWLAWVLANAAGGAYFGATTGEGDIFGPIFLPGLIVGTAQWLVLRRNLSPHADWWIPASALGWILGSFVIYVLVVILGMGNLSIRPSWISSLVNIGGIVYGATLGTAQWLVLRGHTQHAAGWWVLVSIIGGAVGYAVTPINLGPILLYAAMWAVNGAVTGLALVWLLL